MRIIAGPCLHESLEQSLDIAGHCSRVCSKYGFDYYFKASFDKANRSSSSSVRSEVEFSDFREDFRALKGSSHHKGFKTLTDVHDVSQVSKISDVVDVIQIPAFLCRQTDLIEEAAQFSKILNVKKGQFLAPWDVANIVDKVKNVNPDCEVWITERGTSFGYNRLVVDFTGMQYILDQDICTLVFDATHSVQQPGGKGTKSGGNREYAKSLAYAAAGMGVQNFFMEVHPAPEIAPSDGPNMIRLEDFEEVISKISKLIRS